MAAKSIVAHRKAVAIESIREHVAALSAALGIESTNVLQPVKGDADYQEMVRTEGLAKLMGEIRNKVAHGSGEATMAKSRKVQKSRDADT